MDRIPIISFVKVLTKNHYPFTKNAKKLIQNLMGFNFDKTCHYLFFFCFVFIIFFFCPNGNGFFYFIKVTYYKIYLLAK